MLYEGSFMSDEQQQQQPPVDDARFSRLARSSEFVPPTEYTGEPAAETQDDEVVREYEARYGPNADVIRPKRKEMPRSYSTSRVTQDERLWATVAHASAWLTIFGGIITVGAILPISIFVPLVIFFMFRKRSDFVAFHALQAFVLQLLGTVGAFALLTVGGTVWALGMVVAALLIFLLVGFILVPLWGIVGIALLLAVLLLPLAMLFYSVVAAYTTYRGEDYRYPVIARWVDRQLAGGLLNAA
jgi:uncharacterized Tic20 family protein